MTHVADDTALGKFARQQHDWFRRVREGSLDPVVVGRIVQGYVDGKLQNVECVLDGTHHIVEVEKPSVPPLFRSLSTISVKGSKEFVVEDAFRVNTDPRRRVRIGTLGLNFKRRFLQKVEARVPGAVLGVHELLRSSRDMRIVAELGYEEGVEIFLGHFYEVLAAKQAANDLTPTVGYARDKDGNLCSVGAGWGADDGCVGGWDVSTRPFGLVWGYGRHFLSRAA